MEKIFDSHAHYDDTAFDTDREELLDTLFEKNVCGIINVGCTLSSSEKSIELSKKYPGIYASVGIHPQEIDGLVPDYISRLENLAKWEKVVAIGEIGLDYSREYDKEAQIRVFTEQLGIAKKLSLPVIIHSRDAAKDTMDIIQQYRPSGVLHCFSGSAETAEMAVSFGMYIGFTGSLTFKNNKKGPAACEIVPLDHLLLETDCPYMAPAPFRGKRCDSGLILFTAEKMAEIKGISTDEMIKICKENTKRLFGLEKSGNI